MDTMFSGAYSEGEVGKCITGLRIMFSLIMTTLKRLGMHLSGVLTLSGLANYDIYDQ